MGPRHEQVGAKRSFAPLVVMAAAFFVPAYSDCDGPKSPAEFAVADPLSFLWIAPVFLIAGVFALLTVRVLAAGEVERGTRRTALAAIAILVVSTIVSGAGATVKDGFEWPWLLAALVGTAVPAALIRRARGRSPTQIWDHLVAAFACAAVATFPAIFLGTQIATLGAESAVKAGGYAFVLATAALLLVSVPRALSSRST